MDGFSIFSKTGKGMLEASGKSSALSRADRAVLAKVDGKTSAADINKHFEKIEEAKFLQLLERFEKEGFVREISSSAPAAAPAAAKPAALATKSLDEDLDFTAVSTPKKPAAKVPVDLAAQARAVS